MEQLLPSVWDATYAYGMSNPTAPDGSMPRAKADPAHGGILFAHLADIRIAWLRADVPYKERVCLLLRFGLDWTQKEIGYHEGVSQQEVSRRCERGIGRLSFHLNGKDYIDGDDDVVPD